MGEWDGEVEGVGGRQWSSHVGRVVMAWWWCLFLFFFALGYPLLYLFIMYILYILAHDAGMIYNASNIEY